MVEKLETWSAFDIDGSIDKMIDKLNDIKKKYKDTHTDLYLDYSTEWDWDDEVSVIYVKGTKIVD